MDIHGKQQSSDVEVALEAAANERKKKRRTLDAGSVSTAMPMLGRLSPPGRHRLFESSLGNLPASQRQCSPRNESHDQGCLDSEW